MKTRGIALWPIWFLTLSVMALAVGAGCSSRPDGNAAPKPEPAYIKPEHKIGSAQTYQVRYVSPGQIALDGRAEEPAWAQANLETHFVFPWRQLSAPATKFRALWDDEYFYFNFRITDADIVVLEDLQDPRDQVFEDRVEMYLCRDERMMDMYCVEIDSRGRVFDYHASYYRQFDPSWDFAGLETKASPKSGGYEIEGRIPLKSLAALGFPPVHAGLKIRCGLYRAEFSHDRSGRRVEQQATAHNLGRKIEGPPPIEEWISWVDPKISEPEFHVPATLGWLEFVK